MRLINTQTLELEEFVGDRIKPYAILSHTWEDGEVTFQDWQDLNAASRKPGYHKIKGACRQARLHDLEYLWVDTNCIDKTSSSELSEAINSMFAWYREAEVCYVYMVDVPWVDDRGRDPLKHFRKSRWWTRGWTLQELIAPRQVGFYSREWQYIGNRSSDIAIHIEKITGIDVEILMHPSRLDSVSVAKRMSWLSRRVTTRVEDRAYCMLGIFDINMPLLYGEGPKAFMRLQEEIIKISNDHTIFCWRWDKTVPPGWTSVLAPSPDVFENSGNFVSTTSKQGKVSTYSMTNAGLQINVEMIQAWSYYFILLDARLKGIGPDQRACLPVNGSICDLGAKNYLLFHRESFPSQAVFLPIDWKVAERDIYVQSRLKSTIKSPVHRDPPRTDGVLLLFDDTKLLLDKELSYTESDRGVYLLERAKVFIGSETYPPDLFDEDQGIFLFTFSRSREFSCGFLRLGARRTDGCVVFLAIKLVAGGGVLWFCDILPPKAWGENQSQRESLLRKFEKRVAALHKDVRHAALIPSTGGEREKPAICIMIGDEVHSNRHSVVRAAYISPNWEKLTYQFNRLPEANSDESRTDESDAASDAPALAQKRGNIRKSLGMNVRF